MEVLKQNWILIVIVGLSIFLLLDINPQLLAILGSVLLIDFSYDANTRAVNVYTKYGFEPKFFGYRLLQVVLILAALLLFKYYS